MSTALLDERPERGYLVHLKTGNELLFQFMPTEVGEKLSVAYQRLKILGMSHEELQYQSTGNLKLALAVHYDAMMGGASQFDTAYARRFLLAACYANRGSQHVRAGAPSRLLFVWPRMWSTVCRLVDLNLRHARFGLSGITTRFTADLSLEVDSIERIDYETIMDGGDFRRHTKAAAG